MDLMTGNILTIIILCVYVFTLVLYLRAEEKNDGQAGFKRATGLKLTLAAMFVLVSFISYSMFTVNTLANDIYIKAMILLPLAMIFAFIGDHFLQYIRLDAKKYKIGISAFMICQILLIVMMIIRSLIGWVEFVITLGILIFMQALMKVQNWELGGEKKILTVYTVFLAFMAAKAVASIWVERDGTSIVFAIGAALFLLSDVFLGIWDYHTSKRIHANLNWITYFAGTMVIALSLNPTFAGYIGF